ncbi:MAG: triose-phosphate isomerase [Rhizobiaceae bacterium]|nr:triose-phosphate isomerase [Rhizobiaceae bacterium]
MTPDVRPLVAGNWKMNGLQTSLQEIISINTGLNEQDIEGMDALLCVPATILQLSAHLCASGKLDIGGQDCHQKASGAHTGDLSAEMLSDAGASHVIVGHSERRTDHAETSEMVREKAQAGNRAGLVSIVCIGETASERKEDRTLDVLGEQLSGSMPDDSRADRIIVAYEPVWAIGTGLVPSLDDVEEAHTFIREMLKKSFAEEGERIRILYGGSVKPGNAAELMAVNNVDGALVGGASLKADDFLGICEVYRELI